MARIKAIPFSKTYDDVRAVSRLNNEHNDCAVVAVSIAADVSYEKALAVLTIHGRKPRRGTPVWVTERAMEELGFNLIRIDPKDFIKRNYRGAFARLKNVTTHHPRRHPVAWDANKRYMLRTRSHILAVKGGKVRDWTINRALRVETIYEVVKHTHCAGTPLSSADISALVTKITEEAKQ